MDAGTTGRIRYVRGVRHARHPTPPPAFIAIKAPRSVLPDSSDQKGRGYTVTFFESVEASYFEPSREGIERLSSWMQSWVESTVRMNPLRWFWLYSRWIKRSEMRRVIRNGIDLRTFVLKRAGAGPCPDGLGLEGPEYRCGGRA